MLSEFEESLIETTPIAELVRLHDALEIHRQHVLYTLDYLADAVGNDGPRFVFAHVLCPHPPFIFTPDEGAVEPRPEMRHIVFADDVGGTKEDNRETVAGAYSDQVQFVNTKIKRAIEAILARSSTPPIIVVQSDHGSDMSLDWSKPSAEGLGERTAILNAYYVHSLSFVISLFG